MRKVSKDFGKIPTKLQSTVCADLINLSLIERGSHDFQTAVYGHVDVRLELDNIYKSKCAFCETDPSAGVTMQVEHYRPKAKVTFEDIHPGYYWLAYQWSNLLLSCPACNNKKRNRFPINAIRVTTHPLSIHGSLDSSQCQISSAQLSNEEALLVNPEVDPNPMQHFRFQANGLIEHKTERGRVTIETCGLNRGKLIKKRKKLYDTFLHKIIKAFEKYELGTLTEQRLRNRLFDIIEELIDYINDIDNEYTEFAKTCWNEFEGFYLARFQISERQNLQIVYQEIKDLYNEM